MSKGFGEGAIRSQQLDAIAVRRTELLAHVERCLTEPEVEISAYLGEMEKTAEDEVRVLAQDENTRYLLLKADTFLGEGQVVRQPWMSELSPISERDLCGDWVEALQAGQDESPRGPARVLPFPGRDDDDEDDDEDEG